MSTEPIKPYEQLLTPEQLSDWLQVKLSTIYKWTHSGYIPRVRLGGQVRGSIRFSRPVVDRWLERRSLQGRNTYKLDLDLPTA
jgi:excisionase family DNA binding protein